MGFDKKKALILTILICLVAAAFVWVRSWLFSNLAANIHSRLDALEANGLTVTYDALSVNWRTNTLAIDHLLIEKNPSDTSCRYPESIKITKVTLEGVRLIPLIFRNELNFEKLLLDHPHMVMRKNSMFDLDSDSRRTKNFRLQVDKIRMDSAEVRYIDSAGCKNIAHVKMSGDVEGMEMNFFVRKPFQCRMTRATFHHAEMQLLESPYHYNIAKAELNFADATLSLDTIRIVPDFGKFEFGQKAGYEADRIEGVVPFIKARDLSYSFQDQSVRARAVDVQFYLRIFRDKRLPFRKKKKLMPTTVLANLPIALVLDTMKVVKSFVQYEEMWPTAAEAGKVYFDNLEAIFSGINNRSPEQEIKLRAEALLMGEGKVTLSAVFPMDTKKRAHLTGDLSGFELSKINSMLVPSTNIKVESGRMEKFFFDFSHNTTRSSGEVQLNYNDLKLVMFKEEDKSEGDAEKDNLKTFIMNTFIFRRNMDDRVPEEARTGTVEYIRDDSRSIFNFWLKSVLSGIKSAYKLDKIEARKSKQQLRKEARLARREARKLKKAAKEKERG